MAPHPWERQSPPTEVRKALHKYEAGDHVGLKSNPCAHLREKAALAKFLVLVLLLVSKEQESSFTNFPFSLLEENATREGHMLISAAPATSQRKTPRE